MLPPGLGCGDQGENLGCGENFSNGNVRLRKKLKTENFNFDHGNRS